MKKDQITLGGTYLAKVSDKVVSVRLDAESRHGGWEATNLATGKKVRIKSAARLRGPAPEAAANTPAVPAVTPPATAPQAKKATGKAAEPKAKKISGLDAAYQVLSAASTPLRCQDLIEKMLAAGLWQTGGKTPAATLHAALCREIKTKGPASRFAKTDRGMFAVNAR